jgi:hypothetical protein
MDENEAIELLGKLKSFMENTNKQIETLIIMKPIYFKEHNKEASNGKERSGERSKKGRDKRS